MNWYAAPSILNALHQATALWPNRNKGADGTIGDASHAASESDHNPDSKGCVHAFDLTHDPAHGVDTFKLADHLRDRSLADPDFRRIIKYIISNRRIYNPSISPAWRTYNGSSPHTDHVHVSISYTKEAENWNGHWWTAQGQEDEVTDEDLKKIGKLIDDKLEAFARKELGPVYKDSTGSPLTPNRVLVEKVGDHYDDGIKVLSRKIDALGQAGN